MHRLRPRCIITTDYQLLFNQMYEKRDCFLPSLLQAHKKKGKEQSSIKVDLSYAAPWPMKTKLPLQINDIRKSQGFHVRVPPLWTPHRDRGHCLHYCATEVLMHWAYDKLFIADEHPNTEHLDLSL